MIQMNKKHKMGIPKMAKPIQWGINARQTNCIAFLIEDAGKVNALRIPVRVVPMFDPKVITYTLCKLTIPIPHRGTRFSWKRCINGYANTMSYWPRN
ncbi:hypothetical protein BpHYR1_021096 [Brachionus plicatilis]|uniref:Uncharacterized protein n=1 Tax=Brachionus plicatilis TaxID=10195 RepID=A0A3M7SLI2_BRAPC|nr:hypothetical protein BpHYR1_021096 [Brachionus plicatilis]